MVIFEPRKMVIGAIGGAFSAILGACCGWIIFPALVALNVNKVNRQQKFIKYRYNSIQLEHTRLSQQQTVLEEGTEQFERWVNLPQPLHFKVYIFNVTNPKEVMKGATPTVKEVGPYVYR